MSAEPSASFVGRKTELDKLEEILRRGFGGKGSFVVVEGEPGEGKTELVRDLERRAKYDEKLRDAKFLTANCFKTTGENDAYQPFAEIIRGLRKPGDKGEDKAKLKKIASILKEAGPDFLSIFVSPIAGSVVKAGISVFHSSGDQQYTNLTKSLHTQYAQAIVRTKEVFPLLVLVIENCQWMDQPSCQLLLHLADIIRNQHVVIIATCRPASLSSESPFSQLVEETRGQGIASIIPLSGLKVEEIERYIQARFNSSLADNLAQWLEYLCKGNPLMITQYLSLLEQTPQLIMRETTKPVLNGWITFSPETGEWKVSKSLDKLPVPDRVGAILDGRISLLPEDIVQILKIASVQGERFMSAVLSEILACDEKKLLMQLGPVKERHHIITSLSGEDEEEWVAKRSAVYSFEHALLHQRFYGKLEERQLVLYHQAIAESLEKLIRNSSVPPQRLLLEIGVHADQGMNPTLAARSYNQAAQSTFQSGAFTETVRLCELALARVRKSETNPENDKLRAGVILLLLSASELKWRGRTESGEESLLGMVAEAEEASVRARDQVLLSRIKFLRGKILIGTGSISDALKVLQDALATARNARDSFGELMIMSRLGHGTVQIDLDQGIGLLYEANKLFEARRRTYSLTAEGAILDREFYQLKARIGLAEFDRGNLGEAMKWIKEAITGLDRLKTDYELPWALDFLGQVYTTMGRFESAESTLQRALAIHKDEKGPLATRAYNLAELGKLYLEWGRVHDAVKPLLDGLQEIVDAWMVNVVPIVRNYYAELLMNPESEIQDLALAEQQILKALEESRKYNLRRSAIVALSLWGQLSLMQKNTEAALRFSREAVQELEKKGAEPHVRGEEILFNHYVVLKAAGLETEAHRYIEKALKVLQKKAASIPDKESREIFLTRVPISQRIMTASALKRNELGISIAM